MTDDIEKIAADIADIALLRARLRASEHRFCRRMLALLDDGKIDEAKAFAHDEDQRQRAFRAELVKRFGERHD